MTRGDGDPSFVDSREVVVYPRAAGTSDLVADVESAVKQTRVTTPSDGGRPDLGSSGRA